LTPEEVNNLAIATLKRHGNAEPEGREILGAAIILTEDGKVSARDLAVFALEIGQKSERETCAQISENKYAAHGWNGFLKSAGESIAYAIRNREGSREG
jgi:hypothetical protein